MLDKAFEDKIRRLPVQIINNGDVCGVYCPTFNFIEYGDNIEDILQKVYKRRSIMQNEFSKYNINVLERNGHSFERKSDNLKYIFVMVSIIIPLALVMSTALVLNKAFRLFTNTKNVLASRVVAFSENPDKAIRRLNQVSEIFESISPTKREDIAIPLRRTVQALKPFADELRPLYTHDSDASNLNG